MVTVGCAISILTRDTNEQGPIVFEEENDNEGEIKFFAVYGVIHTSIGETWTAVRQLQQNNGMYIVSESRPAGLFMGRRVRRVAIFHYCDANCKANIGTVRMKYSKDLQQGEWYNIVRRSGGYPPHLG